MTLVASVSAGPPLGGLYLKPPSSGGLCDGVITIPSARCSLRAVIDEDGPRDDGRRRDAAVALDDGLDAVRRQHLQSGALGRLGHSVGVLAHVERAVDPLAAAIIANRLCDRRDMSLGEGPAERSAPVAAGPEGYAPGWTLHIGL